MLCKAHAWGGMDMEYVQIHKLCPIISAKANFAFVQRKSTVRTEQLAVNYFVSLLFADNSEVVIFTTF